MTYKLHSLNKQNGFTIVELLVATAVFSTILLIVTIVMVGIGNLYYKGVNQARVQSSVRSLTEELSQRLQLSDGSSFSVIAPAPSSIVNTICIGTNRYSYVLNEQIGSNDVDSGTLVRHVLWRDNVSAGSCPVLANFWSSASLADGVELIAPHSRLTSLSITQNPPTDGPYDINVGMAFGDGDLLCKLSAPGDCDASTDETDHDHHAALGSPSSVSDIICRSHTGDQFCATSYLQTTVVKRLINQD